MPDPDVPSPLAYATPPALNPRDAKRRLLPLSRVEYAVIGGVVLLLFSVFGPYVLNRLPIKNHAASRCPANLRSIGQSLLLYANEFGGRFPGNFETLMVAEDLTPDVFVCQLQSDTPAPGATRAEQAAAMGSGGHLSYVFAGQGLSPSAPADAVIAFESAGHAAPTGDPNATGRNVLFGDGRVTYLHPAAVRHMLNELASGHNPPRPPASVTSTGGAGR